MEKGGKMVLFGVFTFNDEVFLRSVYLMNLTDDNIAHCEECGCAMDVTMMQPFTNVECPECQTHNRVKVDVGSYILRKRQGVGGMSLVFGAVDKTLGREVAIKILNENYSMDAKRIEQFEQEAKITAAISHPHVVRVYTVGQAFKRFFIAMELVPGDSLEQKMQSHGSLSENDVLKWGREVCEGLNAANEEGLIHRDIKPGNILFDAEGHVKIVDFGLALMTQGGKAQADEIWATPYYVPPETLDGLEEDFRSDIYALGASLFHALSGKPPFDTETRSTTELKQIKMNLPSLKKSARWLGDETCAVIDKAMAFAPDDRFRSYKEFIDALHYAGIVLENEGMQVESEYVQSDDEPSSRGKLYAFIAICVMAIGGVITVLTMGGANDVAGDATTVDNVMEGLEGSDDGGAVGKRLSKGIRDGRRALNEGKYSKAASYYGAISRDNRFDMNSVMWGGLQNAIISWLDGDSSAARSNLMMLNKRYLEADGQKKVQNPSEITQGLAESIPKLLEIWKMKSNTGSSIKSEAGALLVYAYALKNWESGYIGDAIKMFDKVAEFSPGKGVGISEEFKVYVSLIPNYKDDLALMRPFMETFLPNTDEEIVTRRGLLKSEQTKLKSKGRAVDNFEEWLIQLDIHQNRLAYERKQEAIRIEKEKRKLKEGSPPQEKDEWTVFYDLLVNDLSRARFVIVSEKLKMKSFKKESSNQKREQLVYLCRKAAGYLETLSETLDKGVVRSEIKLKGGDVYSNFSGISSKGFTVDGVSGSRKVRWGEVETGSVIDLLRLSLSAGGLSKFEKDLRLEQAIAYAWLGGEKAKANTAAVILAGTNSLFNDRWSLCMDLFNK